MAAKSWHFVDSDDELEEEAEKALQGKSVLIVIIDSTPEMFQPWKEDEEDVPFKAAIKCCQAIWRNKVVSSSKDLVSLFFVGTKEMKNSSKFESLYQLQELSTIKVEMIEQLNAMKQSDDFDGFESKIGSSEDYDLKDAFWLAKIIIDDGKASTYQKKIMYFTRNDDPHAGKANLQKEAIKKFKDIGKVELTVVAFNDDFRFGQFYSKIVDDESSVLKADNLENLMKVVRVKQRVRRALTRSTLEISPGVKMGVAFYSFVRPARKPYAVTINKRTNEKLEKTTNEFRAETGMTVLKSEERKMVTIQGEKAVFTNEEIKQVKQIGNRGVTLIGFLNLSDFDQFSWYRSPGHFLYPDEEHITGSKDLFTALLKRCHSLKKVALVKMVLTRGRPPKIACLIPSLSLNDLPDPVATESSLPAVPAPEAKRPKSSDDMFPQGFHVVALPFSDEIRKYDMEFQNAPSSELVTLMEKVIKKTSYKDFDLLNIYNPVLQYHWRELERIALDMDEDEQDEFDDFTEPAEELMIKRLAGLPDDINHEAASCSSVYEGQKSSAPVFKPVNMAIEVKHKRVDKLTIPVLKGFLDSHKV